MTKALKFMVYHQLKKIEPALNYTEHLSLFLHCTNISTLYKHFISTLYIYFYTVQTCTDLFKSIVPKIERQFHACALNCSDFEWQNAHA